MWAVPLKLGPDTWECGSDPTPRYLAIDPQTLFVWWSPWRDPDLDVFRIPITQRPIRADAIPHGVQRRVREEF